MLMLPEEAVQYPRLAAFLKEEVSRIPDRKPAVFSAFCRFGQMSPSYGRQVLQMGEGTRGTLPIIRIANMQTSTNQVDRYGVFLDSYRDIVFLSMISAVAFESVHKRMYEGAPVLGQPHKKQKFQLDPDAQITQINQLMEALLLHEIVHWGDYNNDLVHNDVLSKNESGHGFELAAYGRIYSTATGFRLRDELL